MSDTTKKARLRALLEGVITDLYPMTSDEQVQLSDGTTLAAKLADFIVQINSKVATTDMNTALAKKAAAEHSHELDEVAGLSDALAAKATNAALNTAIANLRAEIMGNGVNTAYDTFTELAAYIAAHQDVADALNSAVGAKADKSAVEAIQTAVNALGAMANKDKVSESDLDSALATKIANASAGNHTHSNKALLDTYTQTEANLKDAVTKKHSHSNATVLNGITSAKVTAWDGKSTVYVASSTPSGFAAGDLLIQLTD